MGRFRYRRFNYFRGPSYRRSLRSLSAPFRARSYPRYSFKKYKRQIRAQTRSRLVEGLLNSRPGRIWLSTYAVPRRVAHSILFYLIKDIRRRARPVVIPDIKFYQVFGEAVARDDYLYRDGYYVPNLSQYSVDDDRLQQSLDDYNDHPFDVAALLALPAAPRGFRPDGGAPPPPPPPDLS